MKAHPGPSASGRYFFPNAPLVWTKRIPADCVISAKCNGERVAGGALDGASFAGPFLADAPPAATRDASTSTAGTLSTRSNRLMEMPSSSPTCLYYWPVFHQHGPSLPWIYAEL